MSSQPARRIRRNECETGQRRARQIASARRMCRNVAGFSDPFTLECWASTFLGRLWEQRDRVDNDDGWALLLGGPVAEDIAEQGGRGAKAALMALARLDSTIFGVICGELGAGLTDVALPHWFDQVGQISVTCAASTGPLPDVHDQNELILLGAKRPRSETYALLVAVDHAQGDIATHVLTTTPYERALAKFHRQSDEQNGPSRFREVEAALACRRAQSAMRRTDDASNPDLHEMYSEVRALALTYLRSQGQPGAVRGGLPATA